MPNSCAKSKKLMEEYSSIPKVDQSTTTILATGKLKQNNKRACDALDNSKAKDWNEIMKKEVWKEGIHNEDLTDVIIEKCAKGKVRFTDPEFPPSERSLTGPSGVFQEGLSLKTDSWTRCPDIYWEPHLMTGGMDPNDVQQGQLGNCWFMSAISSLSSTQDLASRIYPSVFNPFGVYSIRVTINNRDRWVIVDDHIPCLGQRPSFSSSTEKGELWVMLLEKAMAKLHGGYQHLDGGYQAEEGDREAGPGVVYSDFSGGYAKYTAFAKTDIPTDELFTLIDECLEMKGCGSVSCGDENEAEKEKMGIISYHEYSILDAVVSGGQKFLRLRNPWGNTEWKGEYSDGHSSWDEHPDIKKELITDRGFDKKNDGSFWILWDTVLYYYESCYLCHDICRGYQSQGFKGMFTESNSGGHIGSRSADKNPRYLLILDEPSKCFFELKPPDSRFSTEKAPYFGINVLKCPDESAFDKSAGNRVIKSVITTTHGEWKDMEAGKYWIVPTTHKAGQTGAFFFRFAATHSNFSVTERDDGNSEAVEALKQFMNTAGTNDGTVETRLKTAFEALDKDGSGDISVREFKAAYTQLETFGVEDGGADKLFKSFDVNKDGRITQDEFALIMMRKLRS